MVDIFLGVGSNQNREHNIRSGLRALYELLGDLKISPVYESESVGFKGANFFNLVVQATTHLHLADLSRELKKIEDQHGRLRDGKKFSPRSLDIDILTYSDWVGVFDGIEMPRAEILENAYVLLPLSELAPNELHPQLKKTYAHLWQLFPKDSQQLWKINFDL